MPLDLSKVVPIYQSAINDMIAQMGKDVKLYFKNTIQNPSDEFYDPVRGTYNKEPDYKDGSPEVTYNTKTIRALTKLNPSDFQTFGNIVRNPQGILRLKTYIRHVPDLKRCEFVVPNIAVEDTIGSRYKLLRDIVPQGLRDDVYCISFWELI